MTESVKLTKQAVAHRLILSAVRMISENFDPLAVHCLAASASNLLRELVATRGANYGSRVFGAALFENALAQVEGRPPIAGLPNEATINRAIAMVRQGIEDGEIRSAADVQVNMPKAVERQAMAAIVGPYNFMKHADRDALSLLDEAEIRPIESTAHAVAAYALLFPANALPQEIEEFINKHIRDADSKAE